MIHLWVCRALHRPTHTLTMRTASHALGTQVHARGGLSQRGGAALEATAPRTSQARSSVRVRCVWVAAPQRGQSTSSGRLVARLPPIMRATDGRFRAVLESWPRATPQPCAREVIHYHSYLIEIWLFSAVFRYIMGTWTAHEVGVGSSAILGYASGSGGPMGERISAISGRGGSPEQTCPNSISSEPNVILFSRKYVIGKLKKPFYIWFWYLDLLLRQFKKIK